MPLLCRLESMLSVDEAQLKINQLVVSVFPGQTYTQSNNREIKRPHLLLQLELVEGGLQHLLQPLGHRLHQDMHLFLFREIPITQESWSTCICCWLELILAKIK